MATISLLSPTQARRRPGGGAVAALTQKYWLAIASLVVLLVLWQFVPGLLNVPPFIFPSLSDVVSKALQPATIDALVVNTPATMIAALLGLAIGSILGVVCGFLLAEFSTLRIAFYPYLIALQALPKVAVAPLFVIWFGFDLTPKVLIVALLCFFPLLVNTMVGVMSVDPARIDLFKSLCASRMQLWRRLLLPTSLPSIFAGFELAVVFSLLGAIVGEFVSAQEGLGVVIQRYQTNYDTAGVFVVLIVLAALGVVMSWIVTALRKRVLFWQKQK